MSDLLTLVETVLGEAEGQADNAIARQLGYPPGQGGPRSGNYNDAIGILHWAFPGNVPPSSPNATNMATLAAEAIAILASEAFYLYQATTDVAGNVDQAWQAIGTLTGTIQALTQLIGGTATPGQVGQALAVAEAYAQSLFAQAERDINGALAYAYNQANAGRIISEQYAQGLFTQAEQNINGALAFAFNQANAARIIAEQYTQQVAAGLQQGIDDANANANNQANAARIVSEQYTQQVQTILEGQITNGVQQAEQFATNADAGVEAAAVAAAVTQLQPQIDAIKTETDQCLDPLCDTVTPNAKQLGNLGKLLSAFEGAAFLGLIAGLLYELVHDPKGVESDVTGVVQPIANDAIGAIRSLIGL